MSQAKASAAPAQGASSSDSPARSAARTQLERSAAGASYTDQLQMLRPALPFGAAVQRKGGSDAGGDVHETAARGVSGAGGALPHLDRIQSSFGPGHDVSSVSAHVGGAAAQASESIGAVAYATGNNVAFKSAPSLHTAAHEAAHVIQQRHGVSLPGGVGSVGDSYERNADAVADRVVSGKSAADLLPGAGGGASALQMLALQMRADTDLAASTPVNEDFLRTACQQEGKSYEQLKQWVIDKRGNDAFVSVADAVEFLHGLSTRDNYFNNALKVQFENALGQALNADRAQFEPVVNEVLQFCLRYLEAKVQRDGTDLKAEWQQMSSMHGGAKAWEKDLYYGRISNSIDEIVNGQDFYGAMRSLFSGADGFSVSQKCLGIQQFHNVIYEKDWHADQENHTAKVKALLEQLNGRALDPMEVRWGLDSTVGDSTATDIFGKGDQGEKVEGEGGADRRGRFRSPTPHSPDGSSRTVRRGLGAPSDAGRTTGPIAQGDQRQVHGRGIDLWTMDEKQPFIQQARLLDMPLAGSVSGTTSDLITIAKVAGVPDGSEKAFKFVCAALDHFIGAGAHTFHEVVTAATAFGISYTPGDYYSFFQQYLKEGQAKALFDQARSGAGPYKDVKGIGQAL